MCVCAKLYFFCRRPSRGGAGEGGKGVGGGGGGGVVGS